MKNREAPEFTIHTHVAGKLSDIQGLLHVTVGSGCHPSYKAIYVYIHIYIYIYDITLHGVCVIFNEFSPKSL